MPIINRKPVENPTVRGRSRREAKAATKRRVLAAATELFATRGYEATTIRDIARGSGMSTGAVFANWESKADLYADIYGFKPVSVEQGRELLTQLASCAYQFREYEKHHVAKAEEARARGPATSLVPIEAEAKADVNKRLAEQCEALLKAAGWRVQP